MRGGDSGPARQRVRRLEAGDVTDLGDEDRGQHWADPTDFLQSPVVRVALECIVEEDFDAADLVGEH